MNHLNCILNQWCKISLQATT